MNEIALIKDEFSAFKQRAIIFYLPLVFLLAIFTQTGISYYIKLILLGMLVFLSCAQLILFTPKNKSFWIVLTTILIMQVLQICFSRHGYKYTLQNNLFLLSSFFLLFYNQRMNKKNEQKNIFLNFVLSSLYLIGSFYFILECIKNKTGFNYAGLGDQNYTAFLSLIFLYIFINKRKWICATCSIICIFLTTSRAGIIFATALILLYILNQLKKKKDILPVISNKKYIICCLLIFLIAPLFTYIISYLWVSVLTANGIVGYKEGINDISNAIRFSSNINAFLKYFSDIKVIIFGVDYDIYSFLGINTIDPSNGAVFNGFRVVQPHNVYLNLLLREGAGFYLIHFFILSIFLSKYRGTSLTIFTTIIILYSLFMHSLLTNYFLVAIFWAIHNVEVEAPRTNSIYSISMHMINI